MTVTRVGLLALAFLAASASGCNAIVGIDEPLDRPTDSGSNDEGSGSAADATGDASNVVADGSNALNDASDLKADANTVIDAHTDTGAADEMTEGGSVPADAGDATLNADDASADGPNAPVCTPQQKKCNGNTPQVCDGNGQWQDQPSCSTLPFCVNGACAPCQPNQNRTPTICTNNVPQYCDDDGQWQNADPCPPATPACFNGICGGACPPNATPTRCVDNTPQFCDGTGHWQASTPCQAGTVCEQGSCTKPVLMSGGIGTIGLAPVPAGTIRIIRQGLRLPGVVNCSASMCLNGGITQ